MRETIPRISKETGYSDNLLMETDLVGVENVTVSGQACIVLYHQL